MSTTHTLPDGIGLIDDMHLGRSQVIGSYVLLGDEPAIVDPGPASTIATLEAGLAERGLALGDIRSVLLTHIHLDHAGATGALVARHPHLRVYVHERGAPHMAAPEKLLVSAARLYGDAMQLLWGDILPVPEQNIATLRGGETLRLGGRSIAVYATPGHASHHVVYFEPASGAAWVGDTCGVRMPGEAYARPATPPPDIDIEAWRRSLATLRDLRPGALLLTHFGPVSDPQAHLDDYEARLLRWAEIVREGLQSGDDESAQIERLRRFTDQELGAAPGTPLAVQYQQATPVEQSWQGLARYWRKRGGAG